MPTFTSINILAKADVDFINVLTAKLSDITGFDLQWTIDDDGHLIWDEDETKIIHCDVPRTTVTSRSGVCLMKDADGHPFSCLTDVYGMGCITRHIDTLNQIQLASILLKAITQAEVIVEVEPDDIKAWDDV